MRSVELSERVAETVAEAQSRIVGVGKEQYEDDDTMQRFERRTLPELVTMIREEVIDIINWAVMLDIMLQRRIEELDEKGE